MRIAVDSSVVIAGLVDWNDAHTSAQPLLLDADVPGHCLFEVYSTLTRLPPAHRLRGTDVRRALAAFFPPPRVLALPPGTEGDALEAVADAGIAGGATYDALIAWVARSHGRELVSLDQRAARTYERIGVEYRLL